MFGIEALRWLPSAKSCSQEASASAPLRPPDRRVRRKLRVHDGASQPAAAPRAHQLARRPLCAGPGQRRHHHRLAGALRGEHALHAATQMQSLDAAPATAACFATLACFAAQVGYLPEMALQGGTPSFALPLLTYNHLMAVSGEGSPAAQAAASCCPACMERVADPPPHMHKPASLLPAAVAGIQPCRDRGGGARPRDAPARRLPGRPGRCGAPRHQRRSAASAAGALSACCLVSALH